MSSAARRRGTCSKCVGRAGTPTPHPPAAARVGAALGWSVGVSRTNQATASATRTRPPTAGGGMDVGATQLPLSLGPQMPELRPGGPNAAPAPRAPGSRSAPGARAWQAGVGAAAGLRTWSIIAWICSGPPRVSTVGAPDGACSARVRVRVWRCAGLQGGPLGQLQHLHPARRPTMITGEGGGQLGPPDVDDLPSRRPALAQPRGRRRRLANRRFRAIGPGPLGEPHPEGGGEVILQGGVIRLRDGDVGGVQDPTINQEPPPGQGLRLVRRRDMGVQIRIPGPGVAVGERGRRPTR